MWSTKDPIAFRYSSRYRETLRSKLMIILFNISVNTNFTTGYKIILSVNYFAWYYEMLYRYLYQRCFLGTNNQICILDYAIKSERWEALWSGQSLSDSECITDFICWGHTKNFISNKLETKGVITLGCYDFYCPPSPIFTYQ